MQEDTLFLRKRIAETARRADRMGCILYEGFFAAPDVSVIQEMLLAGDAAGRLFGGFEGAERCMVSLGGEALDADFPISCVAIRPKNARFMEDWTHRDVLGALMHQGIERDVLGDIRLSPEGAWVFVRSEMAETLCAIPSVRHTTVRAEVLSSLGEVPPVQKKLRRLTVSSPRADVLLAELGNMSRAKAAEYFPRQMVYIDSRLCMDPSRKLREMNVISFRGIGKFRYLGEEGTNRRGRLIVELEEWI